MPQVRLLTSMVGISVIDCNEAEALRFIKAGIAEPIDGPHPEKATKKRAIRRAVKGK